MAARSTRNILATSAGILGFVALWHILAIAGGRLVLATPADTVAALFRLMGTGRFWFELRVSFERIVAGILIGGFAGFVFGLFAGLNETVRTLLEPLRWTLMSIPAVVVVVMAMLWFGMGSTMVVSIASLLLAPIVYINTVKGLEMVDSGIIEMAKLYRFSTWMTIRHVYIPAIIGPLASGTAVAVGMGVRVVILAEVMGAAEGIGNALALSRTTIDIPELYAWVLVSVGIVGLIEYAVLKPVEKRAMRWRS